MTKVYERTTKHTRFSKVEVRRVPLVSTKTYLVDWSLAPPWLLVTFIPYHTGASFIGHFPDQNVSGENLFSHASLFLSATSGIGLRILAFGYRLASWFNTVMVNFYC